LTLREWHFAKALTCSFNANRNIPPRATVFKLCQL